MSALVVLVFATTLVLSGVLSASITVYSWPRVLTMLRRHKARKRLREARDSYPPEYLERYIGIIGEHTDPDAMPYGGTVLGNGREIIHSDGALEKLLGRESVVGDSWLYLMHPADLEVLLNRRDEGKTNAILRYQHKDGKYLFLRWDWDDLPKHGLTIARWTNVHSMEHSKRARALLERLKSNQELPAV